MISLVAQHNDSLGLEMRSSVTDPLRPISLLSDGQNNLAPHDSAVDLTEQLVHASLTAQVVVENRLTGRVVEMKQEVLRQLALLGEPRHRCQTVVR